MEKIFRQSMLYDFYGELLTEHQKRVYEDVVMNDLSYSEIARLNDISRQGVYDMVKRCDKILEEYEAKLKLVERFMVAETKVGELNEIVKRLKQSNRDEAVNSLIDEISAKSEEILQEF